MNSPLTTSIDTVTGANQHVEGTGLTFTPMDSINVTGTSSLTINDTTGASAAGVPTGVTVNGIQTANINSTGSIGNGAAAIEAASGTVKLVYTSSTQNATSVLTVGGTSVTVTAGATDLTGVANGTASLAAVKALYGAAGYKVITTGTPVAGEVLITAPTTSSVLVTSAAGQAIPGIAITAPSNVSQLPAVTTVAATAAVPAGAAYDVSGWTGLTDFNGTSIGGENVKAAATTNITNTDSALGTGTILTAGGNNVSITAKGVASTAASNGTITIGSATASAQPAGTVSVTATGTAAGSTIGAIQVNGGTTVTVTQGTSSSAVAGIGSTTQGAVTVNGNASTTSVTVNQAAAAAAATAAAAVTGTVAVAAATGGPGLNKVSAVTGVLGAAAVAGAVGAATGTVAITDKYFGTTTANSITSVSLANIGNTVAIKSNALTTLSLSGTSGASNGGSTVTITNATDGASGSVSSTNTGTLTLNVASLGRYVNIGSATAPTTAIVDANNTYSTINLVTSGEKSTISLDATSLKALNISGSAEVISPLVSTASTLAITVSGAAGYNDGNGGIYNASGSVRGLGAGLTLTSTSSGTVTVSLDPLTQSFSGSATGRSVITIYGDAQTGTFNAITGNGVADKLLIDGTTFGLTTAQQAKLTGFEQVGVSNTVSGTINLANLAPTATLVEVAGTVSGGTASGGVAFTNAAAGAVMQINKTTITGAYSLAFADSSTNTATLQLGKADNATTITVAQVGFTNSSGSGVSTLNVVSNNSTWTGATPATQAAAPLNTITDLANLTLGTVNVTGNAGLTISDLTNSSGTPGTNAASTFTLNNNTSTVGTVVELTKLTDNNLTTLNLGGTGNTRIATLAGSVSTLTINNTGSGTAIVGDSYVSNSNINGFLDGNTSLTNLTITGQVQIGANIEAKSGSTGLGRGDIANAIGSDQGVTVSAAANNAHMNIALRGAAKGMTDTITVGNGNNVISDQSINGTVNITVGSGSNLIDVSAVRGNSGEGATYFANVTIGADAVANDVDIVAVSALGATTNQYNTIITGATKGDVVYLTATAASGTTITKVTGTFLSVNDAIAAAWDATGTTDGASAYVQYAGNTYVVANDATDAHGGAGDTAIQLVGVHDLTINDQTITLAS